VRRLAALLLVLPVVAGCSSSSGSNTIDIAPAKKYDLVGFRPAGPVRPGQPTTVAFTIRQPSGASLTKYRTGGGPHTGVHLIIVKDDLSTIIHRHPPIRAGGRFQERVVFPSAGRYRVIVDAYPRSGVLPNFQLFKDVTVTEAAKHEPLGGYSRSVVVDGMRFSAPPRPVLRAGFPKFVTIRVADAAGRPARFVPWYGALAHAIFFRSGTLDYVHTHVCAPGASGCASLIGGSRVAGRSNAPGKLTVGIFLPTAGTWKMFLQARPNGKLVTVPYVLQVK
jgi:hypothetical protein